MKIRSMIAKVSATALSVALWVALNAHAAAAACAEDLTLTPGPIAAMSYDPLAGIQIAERSFRIQNRGDEICKTILTIERQGARWDLSEDGVEDGPLTAREARGRGRSLRTSEAQLTASGRSDEAGPRGSLRLPLRIKPGETAEAILKIALEGGQFAPASATPRYVLKGNLSLAPEPGAAASITLSDEPLAAASVLARAQLNFAGMAAAFGTDGSPSYDVDFGDLKEGDSRSFAMQLRGNTGVNVTFESAHGGVLAHETPGVTATIPYRFTVEGKAQTLSAGPASLETVARPRGQNTPLSITIGDITAKPAGRYSDTITVTVQPN